MHWIIRFKILIPRSES